MKYFSIIASILIFASINAYSQTPEYKKDEVLITSRRTPTLATELTRSVTIIDSNELKASSDLHSALKNSAGVDIQTRGIGTAQSDVSLRGSTFEQVLILIDGIRVNDSQTGHHNLDLSISLNQVERIEVLKGNGSQAHGANAFGGVINIITKKAKSSSFNIDMKGGTYNFFALMAPMLIIILAISILELTPIKRKTTVTAIIPQIDNYSLGAFANAKINSTKLDFNISKSDKKFGANNFYFLDSNQWEHTTSLLSNIKSQTAFESTIFRNSVSYRLHDDAYFWGLNRKSSNTHSTKSYAAESQISFESFLGSSAVGLEFSKDRITSTNLGNHERNKGGLFLEQSGKILKDISYVINYTAYNYSDEGWKSLPNLELGYNLLEDFRIFSSYGISFRLPSFTELYYNTPKLKGSALLKPENGSNFELGLSYSNENYKLNASYYIRSSDNAIDWALLKGDSIYNCMNIQNMQYNGIEANLELNTNTIFSEMIYSINFGFFSYFY